MKENCPKVQVAKNAKDGTAKLHICKFASTYSCTLNVKPTLK